MIDADALSAGLAIPVDRAARWVDVLNDAMDAFEIDSSLRVAAFLAQVGHESAHLTRWVENMRYTRPQRIQDVYGRRRFPTLESAVPYANNPRGLAEFVYGNREDLGNTEPGDGARFIGRGLIQLTGRRNYTRASEGMDEDYVGQPELLEEPYHAAMASAWWWADYRWRGTGLNEYADEGMIDCIGGAVNRGNPDKLAIGADERRDLYDRLIQVLTA